MGVNLSFRLDLAMDQAEGWDGPVEIFGVPVGLSQGQLLTQSRFIDLDDLNSVGFQVEDLFLNCQG